jgi:hypothetical protein
MSACTHPRWSPTAQYAGCHWVETDYRCPQCGVNLVVRHERVADDPAQRVWLAANCERCNELARGADPRHDIIGPEIG